MTIIVLIAAFLLLVAVSRAPVGASVSFSGLSSGLVAGGGGGGLTLTKTVKLVMRVLITLGFGAYSLYILFLRGEASAAEHEAAAAFGGAIMGHWLK